MLKKIIESDKIYIFPQAKSSKIREMLKLGKLRKKDWVEEEEDKSNEENERR